MPKPNGGLVAAEILHHLFADGEGATGRRPSGRSTLLGVAVLGPGQLVEIDGIAAVPAESPVE